MDPSEWLELGDRLGVQAEVELSRDLILGGLEPELLEASDLSRK
jgi:hypothetical protein